MGSCLPVGPFHFGLKPPEAAAMTGPRSLAAPQPAPSFSGHSFSLTDASALASSPPRPELAAPP